MNASGFPNGRTEAEKVKKLILLAAAAWCVAAWAGPKAEADLAKIAGHFEGKGAAPWTWVFYGDSITHGAAHTHGWRSFVEIFQERVRYELRRPNDIVVNSAISGQTARELLNDGSYEWRVRRFKPDAVVLMIGMNDIVRGGSADEFRTRLETLLDRFRADGAIPVLQTPNTIQKVENPTTDYLRGYLRRFEELPAYAEVIREVAAAKDVILVDHFAYWSREAADPAVLDFWLGETIHPGPRGHQEMAALLLKELNLYSDKSACLKLQAGGRMPSPPAGDALAAFAAADWQIVYDAAAGLPAGANWKSAYPAGALGLVEGPALRLDQGGVGRAEHPIVEWTKSAELKSSRGKTLFEAQLRFPPQEAADAKKPYRFFLTLCAGGAELPPEVILQLGPERLAGTLGSRAMPKVGTDFFTLKLELDNGSGRCSLWIDDQLIHSGESKRMSKRGARLNFGDGSSAVGGVAELKYLKVAFR